MESRDGCADHVPIDLVFHLSAFSRMCCVEINSPPRRRHEIPCNDRKRLLAATVVVQGDFMVIICPASSTTMGDGRGGIQIGAWKVRLTPGTAATSRSVSCRPNTCRGIGGTSILPRGARCR